MVMEPRDALTKVRRLYVGWQHPERRAIEPVASLVQVGLEGTEPTYYFSYLKRAEGLADFVPFTAFPDLQQQYVAHHLFPFFANRTMSRKRSDYPRMMELLDLSVTAEPFEVLARSGGKRATDRLEVFPEPECDNSTGRGRCLFFARGLRYVTGSESVAQRLTPGDSLRLLQDVQNPSNRRAFIITTDEYQPIGWVPDYLVGHVQDMLSACEPDAVRLTVEHVNAEDSPRHMRVLCHLSTCWPTGYRPFAEPEFQPITPFAVP
jgi:hypothetical protein